jgi:hypothetical protein
MSIPQVSVSDTDAEGRVLTVIVSETEAVQPAVEVTVTVYEVVEFGDTDTDAVVLPLSQT